MKKIILPIAIAAAALAVQFALAAPPPDVKEIMSKPFTDIPGKEGLVLTVTYPPGCSEPDHRALVAITASRGPVADLCLVRSSECVFDIFRFLATVIIGKITFEFP